MNPHREEAKRFCWTIAAAHGVTFDELFSRDRSKRVVACRNECYGRLSDAGWSAKTIGLAFERSDIKSIQDICADWRERNQ